MPIFNLLIGSINFMVSGFILGLFPKPRPWVIDLLISLNLALGSLNWIMFVILIL